MVNWIEVVIKNSEMVGLRLLTKNFKGRKLRLKMIERYKMLFEYYNLVIPLYVLMIKI